MIRGSKVMDRGRSVAPLGVSGRGGLMDGEVAAGVCWKVGLRLQIEFVGIIVVEDVICNLHHVTCEQLVSGVS